MSKNLQYDLFAVFVCICPVDSYDVSNDLQYDMFAVFVLIR